MPSLSLCELSYVNNIQRSVTRSTWTDHFEDIYETHCHHSDQISYAFSVYVRVCVGGGGRTPSMTLSSPLGKFSKCSKSYSSLHVLFCLFVYRNASQVVLT